EDIPAALDAAITGPADKDRVCMKVLLIPEARMTFFAIAADGAPSYKLETLDDWIARVRARGHAMLEEKQLKFRIDRYGNIAHLWSSYTLQSDGKQVARGINSIQAIKGAGGWRVTGIMVQAESVTAPLPKEYLPPKQAKRRAALPRGHSRSSQGAGTIMQNGKHHREHNELVEC